MASDLRTEISGVVRFELDRSKDQRGSFSEIWRDAWISEGRPMIQANRSESKAGVLRGLHFHRTQADYWVVMAGEIVVCLLDVRTSSPTNGTVASFTMEADTPSGLYIPPGVAHGFYAVKDSILMYLVDAEYDGGDEFGVAWDDPLVAGSWPTGNPILSERDMHNPRLTDIPEHELPAG